MQVEPMDSISVESEGARFSGDVEFALELGLFIEFIDPSIGLPKFGQFEL